MHWPYSPRWSEWAFLLAALLIRTGSRTFAVPACPDPIRVRQPDGSSIRVFLRGDEHLHWHEDESGFTILKEHSAAPWVYAVRHPSGGVTASRYIVGKADPGQAGVPRHLRPVDALERASASARRQTAPEAGGAPGRAPGTGTMKNLVILVAFSDKAFTHTSAEFGALFNTVGYTADGAQGSVKDYYDEVSYGQLSVDSVVTEPVTLDRGYAHYGANDPNGYDVRPREMVQQALAALEARGFDFSTLDSDNDGWVDGLTVIHAGGGEEYGGNDADYIWSHQWALASAVTYDGKSMQTYHTEPERRGWDSSPGTWGLTRIGVICHENGHFLGLPDLYDYGYDSSGVGDFCLMAGGSWNGDIGTQPAHPSAWCKKFLAWLTPVVVTGEGTYSVPRVEDNRTVYQLSGVFPPTQYFLVENRQGYGFDASLPGSTRGLLLWHVDETVADNDDQTHYKVDLEEASGTQHLELNSGDGDDADYFRAGTMTVFTPDTAPNNRSYAGVALGMDIASVSASDATMTFTVGAVPLGSFGWGTVESPRPVGVPFPVSITARNAAGGTASSFTGTVNLSGCTGGLGSPIGTGSSSSVYPLATYYHDARTQVIYLTNELGGARTFTGLALDVTVPPGQVMNHWTVRMKYTSLASYPTRPSWESAGWTVVYQANQTVSSTGWVLFQFSAPFAYNGTDNLMVDFSFNNSSYTTDGQSRCTAVSTYRSAYFRTDSGYGDPLNWSGTTSPAPARSLYVPNIRLSVAETAVPVSPPVSGNFAAGVWTGSVTVASAVTGMRLRASDGLGHSGDSGPFTTSDLTGPTIASITSATADGAYDVGAAIGITVNFSEPVTLAGGTLVVTLETGATDREIAIGPFALTGVVSSVYWVQPGDASPDLSVKTLALSAGTLRDAAGNAASLSIPSGRNLDDSKDIAIRTPRTLTVVSAHGGADPGTEAAAYGTTLSQWVTNSPASGGMGTQYVCVAATVAGNAYAQVSPTHVTLTLTNDATLTWRWQTQYRLDTEAGPHGSVTPADGWHNAGAAVVVAAAPEADYRFARWTGPGTNRIVAGSVHAATVTVSMASAVLLQATFEATPVEALCWAFDETAGTAAADGSGNGNTGTVHGARWVTGPVGGALAFTNTTGTVKRYPMNGLSGGEISVAFWVKTTDAGDAIVSYATGANADEWLIKDSANLLIFRRWQWVRTGVRVNDGLWHHVAITWRSSDGQIVVYKDGVEASRRTLVGTSLPPGGCLMVGQDQDSVGGGLDPAESHQGELDELRVYRGVLNATEIQALYARNSLPVLHWAFGEGSGPIVADSAGCGNTGTVSAAQWVTGPVGNALRLTNTTSSVKRQPVNRLGGAEISAAFWVKTTDSGDAIVSYAAGISANEWLIQDSANLLVFRRWQWVRTGVRVNDGLWHHVAITWRSSDGQIVVYKDGVEASRKTLAGGAIAGNGCLMLGQDQDSAGGGLDPAESHQGELDEVRIYRRVLTAAEVQALYAQNTLPVLHWAFGEEAGPIVADSAGCGNTGTVSAAQWVVGPVGNALRFTNTTGTVKRTPVNRFGGGEISTAFWVKTTDSGDAVVSYATGTSANEWLIQDCANLLVFRRWQWVRTGVRVNDGLWHHVAVTWRACDGQTVVYKDGVEASRKTLAGSAIAGNGCLMLGQDQDNVGGGLDPAESHQGELDEVRVYRRALSASEVQALFGQGTPASGSEAEAAAAPLIALDAASSQGPSAARVAGDSGPTWIRTGTASDGDVATEGPGASEGRFAPFDRTAGAPAIAEVRSDWPGPVRVMTSDDGPGQANGWAAVDGDLNTAWRGAPGRSAWWLALAYEPELVLAELTVRFGEGSLTNAAYRYSRDAVEWLDLRAALTRGPVALTYLWMGIPSDGTTNTLRVVEIESESPVRPSGLPAASTNDSACP